ncbi:MAG: nucleoside 2-deoxyribosyltransferase [Patescibacteria group bacterium]
MLIYFTGSVSAKEKFLSNYLAIIDTLKKQGHEVIAEQIIQTTEDNIRLLSKEERVNFHDKVKKWINSCDFLIAETSHPSTSVGYEIGYALRVGKPVLILYSIGDPPSLLGEHEDEKVVSEKYTLENVGQITKDFVSYVEGKQDLRFTFFITPKLVNYLDNVAKERKIPKSVYLRKLIEQDMEKSA